MQASAVSKHYHLSLESKPALGQPFSSFFPDVYLFLLPIPDVYIFLLPTPSLRMESFKVEGLFTCQLPCFHGNHLVEADSESL